MKIFTDLFRRKESPESQDPSRAYFQGKLAAFQRLGETARLAGGKMSHLGRLTADLALPVPEGFVVTAAGFARFMAHAGITKRVREHLAGGETT